MAISETTKKIGIPDPLPNRLSQVYASTMNPTHRKSQSIFNKILEKGKHMLSLLKTLTYGQRLQIAEGSIKVPLDRDDIETWVTKSEERNERLGKKLKPKDKEPASVTPIKEDTPVTEKTTKEENGCQPHDKGYFCWSPKPVPQCYGAFEFNSCCCEDGTGGLVEALYQFILAKKAGNPSILSVNKRWSPNGACSIVDMSFTLGGNSTATLADYDSIAGYYLSLLGY